jgi:hypothetical protein
MHSFMFSHFAWVLGFIEGLVAAGLLLSVLDTPVFLQTWLHKNRPQQDKGLSERDKPFEKP